MKQDPDSQILDELVLFQADPHNREIIWKNKREDLNEFFISLIIKVYPYSIKVIV